MENQRKQFALSLIAYASQREISAHALCKNANIDLTAIKLRKEYIIAEQQMDDLWQAACRLGNDPLFGLHFGESLRLPALGVVGEIIKSSQTVGQALEIAASLTNMVTDLFTMKVTRNRKAIVVELVPTILKASDFTMRQMTDLLMVFVIHELDGLLLEKITPTSVYFPYSIPDEKEYTRVLRCKPLKRKDRLAIHFEAKLWEEPILSSNYELQEFLLQTVNGNGDEHGSPRFMDRIHDYVMRNAYLGIPSLEDVASNFNVTPRSLQRRLQEEGATYQQVSDAVRKSLALQYIRAGDYPIKEISLMLGYNELSAFSRAFKRWTGKAPTNFVA
ncbi:MAG TPA: AraC family transcriptional regulator ligand-binding domain-containing protein [Chryseolinea sp.]